MGDKHRSPIWKMPKEELEALVRRCKTQTEVLQHFGLKPIGGNPTTLKNRLRAEGIDYNNLIEGAAELRRLRIIRGGRGVAIESVLVQGSTYSRYSLKQRLMRLGMLKNECSICGLKPEWRGKSLIMILDHMNGIRDDNRITNLRLICPNCNTQTDTFASKNIYKQNERRGIRAIKNNKIVRYDETGSCIVCGKPRKRGRSTCSNQCRGQMRQKIDWSKINLTVMRDSGMTNVKIAQRLGVSEMLVRRRLKRCRVA